MNLLKWTLIVFFLSIVAEPATAQRSQRGVTARYGRNSNAMKNTLDKLGKTAQQATCQIRDGKNRSRIGYGGFFRRLDCF